MKSKPICIVMASVVVLLLCGLLLPMIPAVSAEETMIYLSDRQDLLLGEDSLENIGWDTAHSGEPITIGTQAYAKGLGFHCLPDRDAYVEFDISSLGAEENAVVDPDTVVFAFISEATAFDPKVTNGIFSIAVIVPAIGFALLALILWFWYPLHKKQYGFFTCSI